MLTTLPIQGRFKRVMPERVHDHLLPKFSDTERASKAWRHVINHRRSTMIQACNLSRQQRPQDRWQAVLDWGLTISLLRSPTQKRRKEWHTLLTIHAYYQRMMSSKAITNSGPSLIRRKKTTPFTSWARSTSGYQLSLWTQKSSRVVKITRQVAFQIAEVQP